MDEKEVPFNEFESDWMPRVTSDMEDMAHFAFEYNTAVNEAISQKRKEEEKNSSIENSSQPHSQKPKSFEELMGRVYANIDSEPENLIKNIERKNANPGVHGEGPGE